VRRRLFIQNSHKKKGLHPEVEGEEQRREYQDQQEKLAEEDESEGVVAEVP
jgi:hypothetical protein